MANSYRLRPRFRGLAFAAIGTGGALGAVAVTLLGGAHLPLASGIAGLALGAAYLASPMWRWQIVVDDEAFELRTAKAVRFRVAWSDVRAVVSSPATHTCFVDGGEPAKSFVVPGVGAPAPYDIERKAELYDAIIAHVDAAKVQEVATLEEAKARK